MPVNTNAGRAELASMVRERMLANRAGTLIAFGAGEDWWGRQRAEVVVLDETGTADLARPVMQSAPVTVSLSDGSQEFAAVDYVIDPAGRIRRTDAGAIPAESSISVSYTAAVPVPELSETALIDEVGRGRITNIDFVSPLGETTDPDASILAVGNQTYAFSDTPTRMLLVRARLSPGDAVGKDISEIGLFSGCEVAAELPQGQLFYDPDQVVNPGTLLVLERLRPVTRDGMRGLDVSFVQEI